MFDNVAHPGLKALLSFEATRHQVPIEYRETPDFPPSSTPFVPRVEIVAYAGLEVGGLSIPLPGGTMAYEGPLAAACGMLDEEVHIGDGADAVLVGGVAGMDIPLVGAIDLVATLHLRDQRDDVALAQGRGQPGAEAVDADRVAAEGQPGLVEDLLDRGTGVRIDLVGGRTELQDLHAHLGPPCGVGDRGTA